MDSEHILFLRNAFEEYLQQLNTAPLEPSGQLLNYEFDFLNKRKWRASLVRCETRELTNLINRWNSILYQWNAWNLVLKTKDENEAWDLRAEFVESLAYECLLKPSSIRDTFTSVATNALHQVRLSIDSSYRDLLKDDPSPTGKINHLSRAKKESRLINLSARWSESQSFISYLQKLNSTEYIKKTSDYRNLANHAIAPSLGIGYTRTVTRSVVPATKLERTNTGNYIEATMPDKMTVSYGYGGTPPLNMEDIRVLNLEQFEIARLCYLQYKTLLEVAVSSLERVA